MSFEDILSSSSLSEEYNNNDQSIVDFNKIVPTTADMTQFFDEAENTNGEYMLCKKCQEAHSEGHISRVMKIKNKVENLRKHLKTCKYFCAEHGIEVGAKQTRSKPTSVILKDAAENGTTVKFSEPPEGCKMIQVKFSRKVEVFDITPNTTAGMVVKDLKTIFGVDDDVKCFLRKENDKKVLLGNVDICTVVSNGDIYRLETVK